MILEVQKVYRLQGINIEDKHIEVIIRQMLQKIRVLDSGDTDLLPGVLVDINKYTEENNQVLIKGKRPAVGQAVLLGITKSAIETNSFLSAASFQETTRVLTDATVRGRRDNLIGLKENVIIGQLIPAGTGFNKYRDIIVPEVEVPEDEGDDFEGNPLSELTPDVATNRVDDFLSENDFLVDIQKAFGDTEDSMFSIEDAID